jgi:hypothetical protein
MAVVDLGVSSRDGMMVLSQFIDTPGCAHVSRLGRESGDGFLQSCALGSHGVHVLLSYLLGHGVMV